MCSINAKKITFQPNVVDPINISAAFRIDDFLIVSGQSSLDDQGEIVGEDDFDKQIEQTFNNLEKVLKNGGSDLSKVVKVTIFLTDMKFFSKVVEKRKKYFNKPYPADTLVEVSSLAFPELMIEIEAIALINGERTD